MSRWLILLLILLLGMVHAAPAASAVVRDGDKAYAAGSSSLYASPWGASATEIGRYYLSSIEEKTDASLLVRWNAPMVPSASAGVYGYTYKAFGDYRNNRPPVPAPVRKVRDVKQFTVALSWSVLALSSDWNLLVETYARINPADPNSIALEIAYFPHASLNMRAFVKAKGKPVGWCGSYFVSLLPGPGNKYQMAAFVPTGDQVTVTLDFKAGIDCLRAKNLLTGGESITGVAGGVEAVTGAGQLTLKYLNFVME